mmetsp:Transcript_1861/g.4150  ORF Transcript_1861/g.4150 Transcript_1861/m.4150 type:complete len:215 (-) Transcript_1861:1484-2128(-)
MPPRAKHARTWVSHELHKRPRRKHLSGKPRDHRPQQRHWCKWSQARDTGNTPSSLRGARGRVGRGVACDLCSGSQSQKSWGSRGLCRVLHGKRLRGAPGVTECARPAGGRLRRARPGPARLPRRHTSKFEKRCTADGVLGPRQLAQARPALQLRPAVLPQLVLNRLRSPSHPDLGSPRVHVGSRLGCEEPRLRMPEVAEIEALEANQVLHQRWQ